MRAQNKQLKIFYCQRCHCEQKTNSVARGLTCLIEQAAEHFTLTKHFQGTVRVVLGYMHLRSDSHDSRKTFFRNILGGGGSRPTIKCF